MNPKNPEKNPRKKGTLEDFLNDYGYPHYSTPSTPNPCALFLREDHEQLIGPNCELRYGIDSNAHVAKGTFSNAAEPRPDLDYGLDNPTDCIVCKRLRHCRYLTLCAKRYSDPDHHHNCSFIPTLCVCDDSYSLAHFDHEPDIARLVKAESLRLQQELGPYYH